MPSKSQSRRGFLAGSTMAALSLVPARASMSQTGQAVPFRNPIALNTSTVRTAEGKSRPLPELIDIASKTGYDAIEPWISEIQDYLKAGGTTKELKQRLADAGLAVPDAIGFAEWMVDDGPRRQRGLDQAKRDMDLVQQLGGERLAAPPVGATNLPPKINLTEAADRYAELFEIGRAMGVTPIIEIWGFSKNLSRLGEAVLIAAESRKNGAAILPDVYHLYKGGSDFTGLALLRGTTIGIFHVNDYPKIDRAAITDADRVYPGDGLAPWPEIFQTLRTIDYHGTLSIELFNRGYWKQDPYEVARTARQKLEALRA